MRTERRDVYIRVFPKGRRDESVRVRGDFHPNVRSVYITAQQYDRILVRLGLDAGDPVPLAADTPGAVYILTARGVSCPLNRGDNT